MNNELDAMIVLDVHEGVHNDHRYQEAALEGGSYGVGTAGRLART